MKREKKIVIIAGPNRAGKTTFAREFLPNEAGCPVFINADLIAAGLSPFEPDSAKVHAAGGCVGALRKLGRTSGAGRARKQRMKTKSTVADADMSKAGRALGRAAARARQLAEQTGTPLYIFKDGRVMNLNRPSGGSYVLREGRPGK